MGSSNPLTELVIDVPREPWIRLGLDIVDGNALVGPVRLRFVESPHPSGVGSWGFTQVVEPTDDVDGIATFAADPLERPAEPNGWLGAVGIDHVVVVTPSLERTCAAIETQLGLPLKRVREVGGDVRQGFHRAGAVIIEVVEGMPGGPAPGAPASIWGLVFDVVDIEAVADRCGPDVVSRPKAAVQPGRLIATVRSGVGLGTNVAFMTPAAPG
jgi:hypothetical protein